MWYSDSVMKNCSKRESGLPTTPTRLSMLHSTIKCYMHTNSKHCCREKKKFFFDFFFFLIKNFFFFFNKGINH